MKRLLLVALSLVVALGAVVAPAAAVPADDLAQLASHFPAETPFFFAMRTDDAFISELDALLDHLRDTLPAGALPPDSLRESLDDAMSSIGDGATFDNTIRTWLGDSMAVGVVSLEAVLTGMRGDPPLLIAFEISDRGAALAFIEDSYAQNDVEVDIEQGRNYTLITPESPTNAFFALGDDVLLLSNEEALLPLNSDFRSLAADADFSASLAALPASDYYAVMALNLKDFVTMSYDMMMMEASQLGPMADMLEDMEALYVDYPRQTLGFTILDGRSLVLDFVQGSIDYSALQGPLFESAANMLNAAPVDLDFAQHIPADVPFALQGTGFGSSVGYAIEAFAFLAEMGVQTSLLEARLDGDDIPAMVEDLDANDVRAFIDLAFAGMTGLNLAEDVLPHLNGNAAVFGRVLPSKAADYTFDAALAFEVTDFAATQAILDQLADALSRYEADFTYEDGVLVLPGVIRGMLPTRYQAAVDDEPTFDFLIGLNEDVLAIGSREAVEFALSGDSDHLAATADFATARELYLEGSQQAGYVSFSAIRALVADVLATMDADAAQDSDMASLMMVLDALNSMSFSGRAAEDGSTTGRFVLTLAE